ncbi:MAG: cysteine hydrolase [Acetobacteraceae bacterium]|nr:cysteine hydrolase [Acetobacteraceae bacterium]
MSENGSLRYGPLGRTCIHLCVDMQNIFGPGSRWDTPWLPRVLPTVERLVAKYPDRTIFTRFIPVQRPGEGHGTWKHYYERYADMTLERLPPEMVDLVPPLQQFVPPAEVIDKPVYSPWMVPELERSLVRRGADAVIVTGTETDVCVLAAVLGAVDRGYRVVVPTDALCSSSDEAHDASLTVYRERYGQQVETATADEILSAWT